MSAKSIWYRSAIPFEYVLRRGKRILLGLCNVYASRPDRNIFTSRAIAVTHQVAYTTETTGRTYVIVDDIHVNIATREPVFDVCEPVRRAEASDSSNVYELAARAVPAVR